MRSYHWGMFVLLLLVGYMVGVWMPGPGQRFRSTIGM